jgi:hypothetical protein
MDKSSNIDGCSVVPHPGWSFEEKDCVDDCVEAEACGNVIGQCDGRWVNETGGLCCEEGDDPYENVPEKLLLRALWVNILLMLLAQLIRLAGKAVFKMKGWDVADFLLFPFLEIKLMQLGYCGLTYAAFATINLSCNLYIIILAVVAFLVYPLVFFVITVRS